MLKTFIEFIKNIYLPAIKSFGEDKLASLAAALSYYAIFSIAPLLVLITLTIGVVLGNSGSRDQIISQLSSALGSDASDLIDKLIQSSFNSQGQILAVIIGFVGLVLAVTGLLDQLEMSFSNIWKLEINRNLTKNILHKFKQLGFVLLVAIIIVIQIWLNTLIANQMFFSLIIDLLSIYLIILLTYKFFINTKIKTRSLLLGSITTMSLLVLLQAVLSWYISNFAGVSAYGAAGSLVVILLWVFYASQVLLFGTKIIYLDQNYAVQKAAEKNISKAGESGPNNFSKVAKFAAVSVIAVLVQKIFGKGRK
jgi:membrane protein